MVDINHFLRDNLKESMNKTSKNVTTTIEQVLDPLLSRRPLIQPLCVLYYNVPRTQETDEPQLRGHNEITVFEEMDLKKTLNKR